MYKNKIWFLSFFILFLLLESIEGYGIMISPDGSLADWKGIKPINLESKSNIVYNKSLWEGPEDLSARLYITTSERYMYIGIKVTDNSLIYPKRDSISSILKSDHIEIWVDTNPTRKINYKMDQYVHQFIFDIGKNKDCIEIYPKKVNHIKSIKYMVKRIRGGYIFEAKIPGFILNSPKVSVENMGILVDVVDVDRGDNADQGTFLSISPNRKWGDPSTFFRLSLGSSPLYTYKAYDRISFSALFYGEEKFLDISNDGIEDMIFSINHRDSSYVEVGYISPSSLNVNKVFSYELPFINVYSKTIEDLFCVEGNTLTGYPVLEMFKWDKNKRILKNVGIIVSKGIEVYPEFKDIDNDGNLEIVLKYKDHTRIYKYMEGRYRLIN